MTDLKGAWKQRPFSFAYASNIWIAAKSANTTEDPPQLSAVRVHSLGIGRSEPSAISQGA
ncbi:hypothetical protein D8666_18690 [Ochrobactrum soli]|nr:hypothetical protein D8666_18690 [[Ochrobactrum] soli]